MAIALLASAAMVSACAQDGGDDGGHGQEARAANPGGGHDGGRPQTPAVPVALASVQRGTISSYYSATATLEAQKEAQVLARVSGVVESLLCEEGDRVSRGQALLRVENDEYRLRVGQAQANVAKLRSRHDRLEGMVDQNLVSIEEYEAAKNDLASAEADEGLARLSLSYTTVEAPFAGTVVRRLVDAGQNVSVGTALFILADFDPLLARIHVPSKEFRRLEADQIVGLVLDSDGQRLEGTIKLVSPVIDPNSGTIKVTVEIPSYPAGTRPGDFAQVQVVTEHRDSALLVPKGAVVSDKGEQVVFVEVDGSAERRVVDVGFRDDLHAEILTGLSDGDWVVVKGQRSLKHGVPLKVLEGGESRPSSDDQSRSGT